MKSTSYRKARRDRRREGNRSGFKQKLVEVGNEYDVTISETGKRGDGIARIDGLIIFVPGTSVGQQVRIRITQVGSTYANAVVVSQAQ